MSNPLFRELTFKKVVEGCGLKCGPPPPMNTPLLDEYTTRAVNTLTATELDALSTEMNDHIGVWICREGFSDFHLGWTKWTWTPDGYRPDPEGRTAYWPLAPYLPISQVAELATLLRQSLPPA